MVIQARERWIIASLALVAVMLAASPWLFDFADATAPLVSATVLALILAAAAFLARSHRFSHAASFALAAGAWSMLSPFLWGFWDNGPAFWSHLLAGATAVLLSVREVELEDLIGSKPPPATGQADLLDEALEQTFPASDPVSVVLPGHADRP